MASLLLPKEERDSEDRLYQVCNGNPLAVI